MTNKKKEVIYSTLELEELANSGSMWDRVKAAEAPNLPLNLMLKLAEDDEWWVPATIIKRDDIQNKDEVLKILSNHSVAGVREAVAKEDYINEELVDLLARDKEALVRVEIAKKTNLKDEIIDLLVSDEDEEVRQNILKTYKDRK